MFGQQKINFQFNEQNSVDICSNICKLQCRKKAHSLLKTTCNFPKFAHTNLIFEGNYITSCRECFKIHIKGNQFSILIISFVGTCTIDQDFEEISLPLFLSLSHIKYLYSISVNKSYIHVLFYLRFSVLPCTFKHEKKNLWHTLSQISSRHCLQIRTISSLRIPTCARVRLYQTKQTSTRVRLYQTKQTKARAMGSLTRNYTIE